MKKELYIVAKNNIQHKIDFFKERLKQLDNEYKKWIKLWKQQQANKRNEIYIMREEWSKFEDIAKIYSLSVSRIRQIYLFEKEKNVWI